MPLSELALWQRRGVDGAPGGVIIEGVGKSLNMPPRMGLECGSIKGLEGLGRVDWVVGKKYRRCGEGRVAADF